MSSTRKRAIFAVPAGELPEKMRADFAPDEQVVVTVEKAPAKDWDDLIAKVEAFQRRNPNPVTREEAVARIRALRDEWT